MHGWFRDTRYAVRQLRKTPAFTLTAILTLALGIGANSTIFSWMSSTLFSPIPGAHLANTALIVRRGIVDSQMSYPDYVDLRDHTKTISSLIGWDETAVDLTSAGKPQRLWASLSTANFFSGLGVRPLLGHFFEPQDGQKPGGSPVVVLSYRTWRLLFNGDPKITGRTIYLNQHPFTVIGVAPSLFQGASTGLRMDIWVPFMMYQQLDSTWDAIHDRGDESLDVMGVLAPGATSAQAQQELTAEMRQIAHDFPDSHKGKNDALLIPLWRAPDSANEYLAVMLPPLMAIALVVLLLACVNVANLFLVRAVARRREMAVRLSLGANRVRLVRQLLVESVLVALAGGTLAIFVTLWSARTFDRFVPQSDLPIDLNMHVDGRVLAVTFALSTLTGIAFGLLPALRSSRIIAQVALSFLLLICGGLFIRSFQESQHADPGFRADHVLLSSIDLYPVGYNAKTGIAFQRELLKRIQAIPGVRMASFSSWSPLGFTYESETVQPEGYVAQRDESMSLTVNRVGPNFLETLGIPLASGRDLQETDSTDTQRVAVVSEAFVQKYWPGQNAIGRRVKIAGDWYNVVGVAKNSKYLELEESPRPFIYWPALQDYRSKIVLDVLVKGDPKVYADRVATAVHSLSPDMPVLDQYPLSRNVEIATTNDRIGGTFVGMFGLVGLALAAIGIYGVIAYTTRQRLHEIGIRMALGAKRRDVFELVLRQGLNMAAAGIALGLVFSLILTPILLRHLYNVAPTDLVTYVSVGILLSLVALGACFLPARRAAQVEPVRVLRYE
jgi:ABC-type antimicrobial peptide transport system permease subunit